jgi:hypothetical protein
VRRLILILALAAPSLAEAAPWAQGKGKLFAHTNYAHVRSTTLFAPDGTSFEIPAYVHDEFNAVVGFGLTERLGAFVSLPVWRSSDLEDFGSESGVGDLKMAVQMQLAARGPWVLAVRAGLQAPTGDETRAGGILPTGTGVWEGDGVLSLGRTIRSGRGWAFVEAGHQVRGGQLRDSFLYALQVGWRVGMRVSVAAGLRGVEPYDNSARLVAIGSPTGLSDRVTYTTYGPSLLVRVGGGWTLHFEVEDTFHARNLAKGINFRTGLTWAR